MAAVDLVQERHIRREASRRMARWLHRKSRSRSARVSFACWASQYSGEVPTEVHHSGSEWRPAIFSETWGNCQSIATRAVRAATVRERTEPSKNKSLYAVVSFA